MKLLGAVLAGGASRRFGSDKAFADIEGRPMIDHVVTGLRPQVDELVICGRSWPGHATLPDVPAPGLGPLGGLCAALGKAATDGFDGVLCMPVDVLPVPAGLRALVDDPEKPWVFAPQSAIGYWPAALASVLRTHVEDGHRSMRGWIEAADAKHKAEPVKLHNLNDIDAARRYVDREAAARSAGGQPP